MPIYSTKCPFLVTLKPVLRSIMTYFTKRLWSLWPVILSALAARCLTPDIPDHIFDRDRPQRLVIEPIFLVGIVCMQNMYCLQPRISQEQCWAEKNNGKFRIEIETIDFHGWHQHGWSNVTNDENEFLAVICCWPRVDRDSRGRWETLLLLLCRRGSCQCCCWKLETYQFLHLV